MSESKKSPLIETGNERPLKIALLLTGTFLVAEVVGGIATKSLALLSDAAHMLTDVMALIVALIAIRIGKRSADRKRTFGYARFEILAAAFNAIVLVLVAFYILYEAIQRFRTPQETQSTPMLIVATIGLVVNLISFGLLQRGSASSLNMKGAYLEVLSDLLGSVGVIVAALVIRFTGWWQIDPILAVLIGFWVLPRTWTLLSQSMQVLLEGVPQGVELQQVYDGLKRLPGVEDVHDLHIWEITNGQISLTVHLIVSDSDSSQKTLESARQIVSSFGIEHTSVQMEYRGMGISERRNHMFAPPTDRKTSG